MRILVPGGAGFIGSHYVRTLLAGGYPGFEDARVTVLDKLTYAGNLANLAPVAGHPRFTFIRGDICDAALLASVVPGHDAVVNFAAETHVDRSIAGAADFVAANVAGVQVLLDACLDGRGPAGGAGLHRRGLREPGLGIVDRRTRCWRRTRPTRRPRPAATSWPAPTPGPTGSTSASRGAATTTARTSSRRR